MRTAYQEDLERFKRLLSEARDELQTAYDRNAVLVADRDRLAAQLRRNGMEPDA